MTKRHLKGYAVRADSSGPIKFLASSPDMARDGLIIPVNAWQLENYRANPVVLWSHMYGSLPIGRTTDLQSTPKGLVATLEFDQDDPDAVKVEGKIRRGYINTVSVGWDTHEMNGNTVTKADLLDISVVAVPSDAKAVALARSAYQGINQRFDYDDEEDIDVALAQLHQTLVLGEQERALKERIRTITNAVLEQRFAS